jgi:small conductance mechanosensitive channel
MLIGMTLVTGVSTAAGDESPAKAVTTTDVTIPVDELRWRVMPLTTEELLVEADAWQALLKEKVRQLSEVEIEIKRAADESADALQKADEAHDANENKQPASVEEKSEPTGEEQQLKDKAEEKKEKKLSAVDHKVQLQEERMKIIDRLNVVLISLKKKGEDVETYENYINAVSGIQIDVSDTAAAWQAVSGWLKSEEGGIRWAKNIGVFILTVIVFWILGRIAAKAVDRALKFAHGISDLLRYFLIKSVRRVVVVIGLIVALSQLEVNIGPLVAAIGAAGFVVAFALQGTLSNFASGLLIMIYKPFDVGDAVGVAGESGVVDSMSLLSTTIKSFDNQTMVIPNNSVWDGVITNVTGNNTRRVDMVFGIGYADDADKAQSILEGILAKNNLVLHDPAPVVRLHELADSSVNFVCRPWSKTSDYWAVKWEVTREVKKQFDAEGISIPFPQRDVHVYQETAAKG